MGETEAKETETEEMAGDLLRDGVVTEAIAIVTVIKTTEKAAIAGTVTAPEKPIAVNIGRRKRSAERRKRARWNVCDEKRSALMTPRALQRAERRTKDQGASTGAPPQSTGNEDI
jgi:hypothetical protein